MGRQCSEVERLITGYVDQELDPKGRLKVEHHLEECVQCRHQYEAERRLKALLRQRVHTVKAPAELRNRIRRRLRREARTTPSLIELLRSYFTFHPALSMATAVALFLVVAMPTYFAFVHNPFAEDSAVAAASGEIVDLSGEIVCVDCAVLLRAHAQDSGTVERVRKEHDLGLHHPGLMTRNGEIYGFLHTGKGLDLLNMPSHGGGKVRIHGVIYPRAHLIEVRSYQII